MILQLIIGSLVVSLTVVIEVAFVGGAIQILARFGQWLSAPP